MSDDDWEIGFAKSVGVFLNGSSIMTPDARGERILDDNLYLVFNAHHEPLTFVLPPAEFGESWDLELDSSTPMRAEDPAPVKAGGDLDVAARSVMVLRRAY